MPQLAVPTEHTNEAPAPHVGLELEVAVRRLLEQAGSVARVPEQHAEDKRVASVEIDGVRYALVRLARHGSASPSSLSPREREIVRLVAKGCPNKTIAAVLDVSTWTVATHLRRVFAKLGVNTRTEMVAQALTHGLIPPE